MVSTLVATRSPSFLQDSANSDIPSQILPVFQSSSRLFGLADANSKVTGLACHNQLVAFSVTHLSGLLSFHNTVLRIADIVTGSGTFYRSERTLGYFLHLEQHTLIAGESEKGMSKYSWADFKAYSLSDLERYGLSENQPLRSSTIDDDTTFNYVLKEDHELIAMISRHRTPTEKIHLFQNDATLLHTLEVPSYPKGYSPFQRGIAFCKEKLIAVFESRYDPSNDPFSDQLKVEYLVVYDTITGKQEHLIELLRTLSCAESITTIAANNEWIALGRNNGEITILDSQTYRPCHVFKMDVSKEWHDKIINAGFKKLQFHEGKLIALSGAHQLVVFDLHTKENTSPILTPSFVCYENILITAHLKDHLIEIWHPLPNSKSNQRLGAIATANKITKLRLDGNGLCLAAGLENGQVQVWHPSISQSISFKNMANEAWRTTRTWLDWAYLRSMSVSRYA